MSVIAFRVTPRLPYRKSPRLEDRRYLNWIRTQPCSVSGCRAHFVEASARKQMTGTPSHFVPSTILAASLTGIAVIGLMFYLATLNPEVRPNDSKVEHSGGAD